MYCIAYHLIGSEVSCDESPCPTPVTELPITRIPAPLKKKALLKDVVPALKRRTYLIQKEK
ncbi:UNVERIFIED_CONTAM: hypothetical protein FKN15_077081 [Acipenser sinensis]